jgi:hypothetical protein
VAATGPPLTRVEMNGMEGDRGPFRGSERGSSAEGGKPSEAERGPAITLHSVRRRARQRADGRQDPRETYARTGGEIGDRTRAAAGSASAKELVGQDTRAENTVSPRRPAE